MKYNPEAWENLNGFDNSGDDWNRIFKKRILSMIQNIDPDNILDVGCCTGHYIRRLRGLGWEGKYTGVDITKALIKQAKYRSPDETFLIRDARKLHKIKDNSFDLVLLLGIIMHLDNYQEAIREAFRVSKNKVIIMCYSSSTGKTLETYNGKFINRYFIKKDILSAVPTGAKLLEDQSTTKAENVMDRRLILLFGV